MSTIDTPIRDLRMVGPVFAQKLKKLGIETISDFLYHLPHRYEDYSLVSKIAQLQPGEKTSVNGEIKQIDNVYTKYGKKIQKAAFIDDTGEIEIVWYNQPFLTKVLKQEMNVVIAGEVKRFGHKLIFESPDYEIIRPTAKLIHTGRLVPVYPETAGISSKWIRSRMNTILNILKPQMTDFLPNFILQKYKLVDLNYAIRTIHFPQNYTEVDLAKRRLSFDKVLIIQLFSQLKRKEWQNLSVRFRVEVNKYQQDIVQFIKKLPFTLTKDQYTAINEILKDLTKTTPMNRLLEGDVGSGKTVVATIAIYLTFLNGYQSILMAPTEILAHQHYETLTRFLSPIGIKVSLISRSHKMKQGLKLDVFVGTHALLFQENIFQHVGLIVIDEQQRFGVSQRATLREKGGHPHLLTMTATPIPRTIALTLYSDLLLSVLNTMPKGRIKPKTWVVPPEKRDGAYNWIRNEIKTNNSQAFIVCPLIDISDNLESVKAAKNEYEKLKSEIFPDLRVGLLHGRLQAHEKNTILKNFSAHKLDILVTTPVVEVGIDIPEASIIMIEGAERFGLAQLHQLRGRVGRRNQQSFCLLFTDSPSSKTLERLKLLTTIYSGSKLAEEDLRLRGAGEIYGTKQHGVGEFKIADITDLTTIQETKEAAELILKIDPTLSRFLLLREKVRQDKIGNIAPD